MRATAHLPVAFALALAGAFASTATAQQANAPQTPAVSPAHTHLGHVLDAFRGTPEGQGLMPVALAEAKIVADHAALAVKDLTNLEAMKQHAGHVIHAIDPAAVPSGPGLKYGLKQAATGFSTHIDLAAKSEGASKNLSSHAAHITAALTNTNLRADQIVALAKRIQAATTAEDAAPLATTLNALAKQLVTGIDVDGDGKIGWHEGEGGLQQAEQHMTALKQGEAKN